MKTVAILLQCAAFENHYEKAFNLDRDSFLKNYRNEWSWNYLAGLKEENIKPILYIPSLNHSGVYQTEDGYLVRFLLLKTWYKWVSKVRFPPKRLKIGTYFRELINAIAFRDTLVVGLEQDKVDVLYVQEYWSTRFDFLIKNITVPIIGADHGGKSSLAIESNKRKSLPKAYKLQCQGIEEVDEVTKYKGNAVLLPNGIDIDFFSPLDTDSPNNVVENRKIIFCAARLFDKQKRISDLIQAMSYLDSSWVLEIAGIGPDQKQLQYLASKFKVAERVSFLGFVKDKKVLRNKYRQCSVVAMPSAWEGLPLTALEAMSCGAAITVTDITAFKHLINHQINGIKVPVGDCFLLAQGILQCHTMRQEYGIKARKIIVEKYSEKNMFSQLSEIIKSCPNQTKLSI